MKKIFLSLAAIALTTSAIAQTTNELLLFSRQNFGLSTARSAAMGGAFVSLGADASSMSINPAGIAMYNASEIVVSPGLKIGASRSNNFDMFDGTHVGSESRSRVSATINNFGAVYATGEWSVGVSYNRLADFNGASYTEGGFGGNSIIDVFVNQLNGTSTGSIGTNSSLYGFNHSPAMWPAILGYQTWAVNPSSTNPNNTEYNSMGILEPGDMMSSTYGTRTAGGIDEFAFSGGYNYNDILYVGATFGIQSLYRNESTQYREFALLNPDGSPYNIGNLDYMELGQYTSLSGVGVNLKVGVTVRPVSWFRVGVAYHSPTWITMNEVSSMDMETSLKVPGGYKDFYEYSPDLRQDYNMSTPSRLLAGMSFVIGRRVTISADYERTWYNYMKYDTPINISGWRAPTDANYIDCLPNYSNYTQKNGDIDLNSMILNHYKATNNYRIGVEARPIDELYLRAGFGYSESPYKDILVDNPYLGLGQTGNANYKLSDFGSYFQYSGGIGYRHRTFSIDLTYVYGTTKTLPSTFFDYIIDEGAPDAGAEIKSDYLDYKTIENHNVILSFAWRF